MMESEEGGKRGEVEESGLSEKRRELQELQGNRKVNFTPFPPSDQEGSHTSSFRRSAVSTNSSRRNESEAESGDLTSLDYRLNVIARLARHQRIKQGVRG